MHEVLGMAKCRPFVSQVSPTSARDMMSGCEDRKICLGEVYLQITASRDRQLMESALDVHISVSNNSLRTCVLFWYTDIAQTSVCQCTALYVGYSHVGPGSQGTKPIRTNSVLADYGCARHEA